MNNLNIPNVFGEEFQVTICSRQQTKADCSSREKANAFSAKHLLTISTDLLFLAMTQGSLVNDSSGQLFFKTNTFESVTGKRSFIKPHSLALKMTQKVSDTNPWSEGKAALNETAVETQFDDNFTQQQIRKSNENGLQLPESEHYLAALGDDFIYF